MSNNNDILDELEKFMNDKKVSDYLNNTTNNYATPKWNYDLKEMELEAKKAIEALKNELDEEKYRLLYNKYKEYTNNQTLGNEYDYGNAFKQIKKLEKEIYELNKKLMLREQLLIDKIKEIEILNNKIKELEIEVKKVNKIVMINI